MPHERPRGGAVAIRYEPLIIDLNNEGIDEEAMPFRSSFMINIEEVEDGTDIPVADAAMPTVELVEDDTADVLARPTNDPWHPNNIIRPRIRRQAEPGPEISFKFLPTSFQASGIGYRDFDRSAKPGCQKSIPLDFGQIW